MGRAGRLVGLTRRSGVALVLALAVACQPASEPAVRRPPAPVGSPPRTALTPVGEESTAATWRRLPDVPGPRRDRPVVQRVGGSVLVLGGTRPMHCPHGGYCAYPGLARGGAVLDLVTRTWRRMAAPPASIEGAVPPAGTPGGLLVVLGDRIPERLSAYDVRTDTWTRLPQPSPRLMGGEESLTVTRRHVYVVPEEPTRAEPVIQRLDLRSRRWTSLPRSTRRPRLALRRIFVTSSGPVVVGAAYDPATRSHTRARAEVLVGGGWRRLRAPGFEASGWEWHWTGRRLVAPFVGAQPRRGLTLDPATGRWGSFRHPAYEGGLRWSIGPAASGDLVFTDGTVYDDRDGGWSPVALPWRGARRGGSAVWVGRRLLVVDRHSHAWLSRPF